MGRLGFCDKLSGSLKRTLMRISRIECLRSHQRGTIATKQIHLTSCDIKHAAHDSATNFSGIARKEMRNERKQFVYHLTISIGYA